MATDRLFYEYAVRFPNVVAKLIGAEPGEYEARSVTLKQAERRADFFLINRTRASVVLVETQGYDDPFLYHRMLATIALFCLQNDYKGRVDVAVIFLDESHHRAAIKIFKKQFSRSGALKFSPKTIVLSRMKLDDLRNVDDVYLKPFFPLCNISPETIEQQAPDWAEEIKSSPELDEESCKNLLGLLAGFISHRIKLLDEDILLQLLGGFKMEEIPIIQEIFERKMKKESPRLIRKGVRKGMRHTILKMIAARFGKVPKELKLKIQMIDNTEDLDRIATTLVTIQSLDELNDLLN